MDDMSFISAFPDWFYLPLSKIQSSSSDIKITSFNYVDMNLFYIFFC